MSAPSALLVALTVPAAMLAVLGGLGKLVAPRGAADAMRAAGIASGAVLVRSLAALECGLGASALLVASPAPRALLAATYAGFMAFALRSMARRSSAGCGCFGTRGGPAGWRHVTVDGVFALALLCSVHAAWYPKDLPGRLGGGAGSMVLLVGVASAALAATVLSRPSRASEPA